MKVSEMPFKKWLKQYLIAFPVLVGIFTLSQYFKGYNLSDAVEFALFWAVITLGIFAISRAYRFYRNDYCALCNDLPAERSNDKP